MKKLLVLTLCICLMLCCCSNEKENTTGDVKNPNHDDSGTHNIDNTEVENEPVIDDVEIPETKNSSMSDYIDELGAFQTNGSEQSDTAFTFCDALMLGDVDTIELYTQGKTEYYEYLSDIDITSYNICSFDFSDEMKFELSERGIYNGYNDKYIVEFDIAESSHEFFPKGSGIYYLECNGDPATGNFIEYFMPIENAVKMYSATEHMLSNSRFIKEFLAAYLTRLEDGENYPELFDFSRDAHLITHLMAHSGLYNTEPPYSLNEINDFIWKSFDGNGGIELYDERDIEYWLFYDAEITEEPFEEQQLFGCSFAHGGTTIVHTIDDVVYDGNIAEYYLTVYADYAHFSPSKKLVLTFEENEDEPVKLMLAVVTENYQRESAGYSF